MKVKSKKYGMIHFNVKCNECNFDCAIISEGNTSQDVRNKVHSHVKKTGHRVTIEAGTSTDYYLEK